jgi:hypothetical protein
MGIMVEQKMVIPQPEGSTQHLALRLVGVKCELGDVIFTFSLVVC